MDPAEDDGILSSLDSLQQPCFQEALFSSQKTRQCQVDPFKVCEVEKESTNPPESEKAFLRAPGSEKMPETLDYGMRSFRACDLEKDSMKHPESEKASLRSPGLGRASETSHYGTTKFLEGLDLVDVLPHRLSLSHSDALDDAEEGLKPTLSDSFQHQSNDLTADFFALKSRYLSSCAVLSQKSVSATGCCPSETHDIKISSASVYSEAQADHGSSSDLHSRASSLDSTELIGVSTCSSKQYLTGVVKEDENEWVSDESETFEFKQPVRNPSFTTPGAQEGNGTRGQIKGVVTYSSGEMCNLGSSYKGIGSTSVKELSVVATGDSLLYTGSNPEEFDLIPSQSPVSSPKERNDVFSDASVANQDFCYSCPKRHSDNDQEKKLNNSLSYDDIILLLEKEELDEDIMISFFNFAKTMQNHGGSSCPASDVASEASFEFRVKSTGSTPHSTPSTPMLSAGSTPKHITQLSPLALTPEEIAEIWGVFEQRQALSPFSRCSYP
ncbi:hypothetical protein KP509_08G041300 [Ceratopteris richardii]|nr:hypothetical protein KP509_08G041300 [Ceratopteris richardii]